MSFNYRIIFGVLFFIVSYLFFAKQSKRTFVTFLLFSICSSILFRQGFLEYKLNKDFINSATKAQAVISDIEEGRVKTAAGTKRKAFLITYEFKIDGDKKIVSDSVVEKKTEKLQIGKNIDIFYNNLNPEQTKINSFGTLWKTSFIFNLMGAMLLTAWFVLFLTYKHMMKIGKQEEML